MCKINHHYVLHYASLNFMKIIDIWCNSYIQNPSRSVSFCYFGLTFVHLRLKDCNFFLFVVEGNWYFSFSYRVKQYSNCFSLFPICTGFNTKYLIAGNIWAYFFPVLGQVYCLKTKCSFTHRPQCVQNHLRALKNKLWLWGNKTPSAFLAKSLMTGYRVFGIVVIDLLWQARTSLDFLAKF